MIVAIDFDGTVVKHEYPKIGKELDDGVRVMKRLLLNGHQLILFTMRSGTTLLDAIDWFYARGINLWGINTNPLQKEWTASPKAFANKYIDDAGLGCPLNQEGVDWEGVEFILTKEGYFDRSKP